MPIDPTPSAPLHWADAPSAVNWIESVTQARAAARTLQRPLLVDFWDQTCLGCLKMLAETFPHPEVAALLRDEFVCLKIDTGAVTEEQRELVRAYRVLWTPDLLLFDPLGAELGRRIGFHTPAEFVAVLRVALGQTAMTYRRYDRALEQFTAAAADPDAATMRGEALFWAGIAAYKLDGRGDRAVLRRHWAPIGHELPSSPWWTRALASYGVPVEVMGDAAAATGA